ncbi:acetylornithine deacetylase [Lichenihabitans sp. Uapishka_5]|uniref:acetylornithine deacetylase n=1 Tax=Lichenihabitans sp. Uapishka_5 TaxID=3037302 RepID=UPI0029E7E6C9|nr:acetylornithine deacetylase [Lichenihabitans sp. Uapishka_5]MDX7950551.1 acetylornithine deacetylase [Lichenihabitans sp. Uapishka_5]
MQASEILARLVGFPSVVTTPNGEIAGWIRSFVEQHGGRVTLIPGPEGDRVNLFASFGPADRPGYILSGHMDVVPAKEADWRSDPFSLRSEGDKLYGRGTSDMKGFLAAVLSCLPEIAAQPLSVPIHLAFSYDEEIGCRGVRHMLARLPDLAGPQLGAIIGEPSGMRAVRSHKGKVAVRAAVRGRTGHSSRPDLALNAIHGMAHILASVVATEAALAEGPFDAAFAPPYSTLQAGILQGGQAVNIIPDTCRIEFEARAIAGVEPLDLVQPVATAFAELRQKGFETDWDVVTSFPGLALAENAPLAALLEALTGEVPLAAVSYGTEAGLFQQAGVDAIICGPGDIARAHKANEYVTLGELEGCRAVILALLHRLRS